MLSFKLILVMFLLVLQSLLVMEKVEVDFTPAAAAAAAGGVSGFDFGVDPNLDHELALALHVSM